MRFFTLVFLLCLLQGVEAHAQTQGYTVDENLIYRINFGSADDVRMLLETGANPNANTPQGESALDIAITRNDKESSPMAEVLVAKGANIDAKDKNGEAPVINAIKYRQFQISKMLLLKGANIHITTASGMPLIEFAKQCGDTDAVKIIGDMIAKENAYAETFRSPARFKQIVQEYTQDSCSYQYWSFFLSSRQAPDRDAEVTKKVADLKAALTQLIAQIQKYYTVASMEAMQRVSAAAVQQVFNELDSMISNSNRAENGVGREEDAKDRCAAIISHLNLDIVPVGILSSPTPAQTPTAAPITKSSAPVVPAPAVTPKR